MYNLDNIKLVDLDKLIYVYMMSMLTVFVKIQGFLVEFLKIDVCVLIK